MPAAQPSKARVEAAIAGAVAAGLRVGEVRIERDGTVRIIAATDEPRKAANGEVVDCDELFKVSG